MTRKRGKGTELKVFSGREAKLNRVVFLVLDSKKLLTSYGAYLEIRKIKGFRHVKRQSVDRRMKALYEQHWIVKDGVRPAKAHFLSPLYALGIRAQVAHYLKLYVELRRKGTTYAVPETITDQSPLIRNDKQAKPKGIGQKQLRKTVHHLYKDACLIKQKNGRLYDLRVHSICKFFTTQLIALGVQPDYVDYT